MKKGSELKKFEGIRSEKVAVEGRTTTREDSPKRAPYLAQLAPWRRTEAALTFQKLGPFDDRVGEPLNAVVPCQQLARVTLVLWARTALFEVRSSAFSTLSIVS